MSSLNTAKQWFSERAGQFSGELKFDEPLSRQTYYRIGGPADLFAVPKTLDDLRLLAEGIAATGVPVFVLGLGSNILVSDAGFRGLVIRASRMNLDIQALSEGKHGDTIRLRTGGSVAVSTLLRRAASEGWCDLELLTGIPGSIGGVVTMNAGTHLGEAKDRLKRIEIVELEGSTAGSLRAIEASEFKYAYRHNDFLPRNCIVWSAEWDVRLEDPARVKSMIDETLTRRKSTQPIDYPSCGSVFKNPRAHGMHAWQVVDKLGLRGHRIGGAQFAEKHSNFIINLGGATATDVKALINLAKSRAKAELGVELQEEVMYLGA